MKKVRKKSITVKNKSLTRCCLFVWEPVDKLQFTRPAEADHLYFRLALSQRLWVQFQLRVISRSFPPGALVSSQKDAHFQCVWGFEAMQILSECSVMSLEKRADGDNLTVLVYQQWTSPRA